MLFFGCQTVRYIGPCPQIGDKQYVGIEFDLPVGVHDGSVAGMRYFSCGYGRPLAFFLLAARLRFPFVIGVCRPNRGTMVLQSDVAPFNAQCAAAVRIQAAARGFRARLYAASRLNWFIYNQLDNDDEKVRHLFLLVWCASTAFTA